MKERLKYILLFAIFCSSQLLLWAQDDAADNMVRGTVTSKADGLPMMQVNVTEVDANNRIFSATVTDMNGEFSMKIKNPKNSLQFKYIGYKTVTRGMSSGERVFNIEMEEDNMLETVSITAKRTSNTGALDIPEREISMAVQKISTKEFEGISAASIDEMLQGRIAGLDILSNSGDLGSGMNMRLRGVSTLSGNTQPLIVVDGIVFETNSTTDLDFATATEDQYAELLQISPDDIETITVLKDAAATAIWGSRGSNGVLQFTTKKGVRGKTRVQYTYRYSGKWQPKGYDLLNGDQYTMYMKEAYFNAAYDAAAADVPEISYLPLNQFGYANEFDDNTDWVDEIKQYGQTHDHYVTVTGGGEKARFRISGGYYDEKGTIIEQNYTRYSSRMNLDYFVSDRLKFTTEFSFTFSDNKENADDLMNIALRKMPNLSIYREDANGNDTHDYFTYPAYNSEVTGIYATSDIGSQDGLVNPIASAHLAYNNSQTYRIIPTFRIQYDFLDPTKTRLLYKGYISFDVNNSSSDSYYPKELSSGTVWYDQAQTGTYNENKSLGVAMEHALTFTPKFANDDHSLMLYAALQMNWGNSSGQTIGSDRLPSGITSPSTGTYLSNLASGPGRWRSMAWVGTIHYAYQSRYMVDFVIRREGSTKFGSDNKFGNFPGISARWNLSDESFMDWSDSWLNMFSIRPSWGVSGNAPSSEYLYYSRYNQNNGYINTSGLSPANVQMTRLKWEKTSQWNIGSDIELFNGKLAGDFNYYHSLTTDLRVNLSVPTSSGFTTYENWNSGEILNRGWEVNLNAYDLLKFGDFSVDFNFNIANNINTIEFLDESVLASYNSEYGYSNGEYLSRIQLHNAFGSIYGFRYKGVYQYNYSYKNSENVGRRDQGYAGEPVARDAAGNVIYDESGAPKHMVFHFGDANQYTFAGGDAIYEDINHDGNIDALDIVYLGNSNPDFNGGFGVKFKYKRLSLNIFSNFRYGNKIVNTARLNLESMRDGNNQSVSINWRWRKDGDVTNMPRALYDAGYNSLGSDRYVEDGSFWRIKYITLNYSIDPKLLKKYYLSQLSFYFTINNLWCFSKYSGVDPEVSYGTWGVSTDNAQTPRSRYFTAGITVAF
ncbi:MAG: SusC/RagA family TonB-linked outer membrane protein [Bacteroidaceae bacterium]|jgi:TonB-linked SusC/RagA family outer membrane protein